MSLRRAMTLVEMLVALTATLVLMGAVAQAFSVFGNAITNSRSMLELDGRLRSTAWRLRADLAGATASTTPPLSLDSGEGYFEIIEGPNSDHAMARYFDTTTGQMADVSSLSDTPPAPFLTTGTFPGPTAASDDRLVADCDDVLLFTTRSTGEPFIGRMPGVAGSVATVAQVESPVAEVAWFARATPGTVNPVTYTLYRKQLLVMGYVGAGAFAATNTLPWSEDSDGNGVLAVTEDVNQNNVIDAGTNYTWAMYFDTPSDISVRREGNRLYPNTLADLTRREARFMHNPDGLVNRTVSGRFKTSFPYPFVNHQANDVSPDVPAMPGLIFGPDSPRRGEDVVLTDVISFDVRVFDPAAGVTPVSGVALVPGDPGFVNEDVNNDELLNPLEDLNGNASLDKPRASGAYVDLGYKNFAGRNINVFNPLTTGMSVWPGFAEHGTAISMLRSSGWSRRRTYCTWSLHYETNGFSEDGFLAQDLEDNNGNGLTDNADPDERALDEGATDPSQRIVDEGTDGIDNDPANDLVDEPPIDVNGNGLFTDAGDRPGEYETMPPYPRPLRGVEIRIRCYEPSSRQVRQVTVRHTFVPY